MHDEAWELASIAAATTRPLASLAYCHEEKVRAQLRGKLLCNHSQLDNPHNLIALPRATTKVAAEHDECVH